MSSFSMIEVLFLAAYGPRGFREFGLFGGNRRSRPRPHRILVENRRA